MKKRSAQPSAGAKPECAGTGVVTGSTAVSPVIGRVAGCLAKRFGELGVQLRFAGSSDGGGAFQGGEPAGGIESARDARAATARPPTIVVKDPRAVVRIALGGTRALAESYVDGSIDFEGDLQASLEAANRALASRRTAGGTAGMASLSRVIETARLARGRVIDRDTARRNAMSHYDLGNDFFALWLDPSMSYTCAYFPDALMDLADAQRAKMDLVCAKLGIGEGDRVVDAGCGWGGLALHMAERCGARVHAYNISPAQIAYAREQAAERGLGDRVTFVEDDYRSVEGPFDVFVSIGMLEAVGKSQYEELGAVIKRGLARGGRGLIHSIGRNEPIATDGWIDRYIFPGSYKPSLAEMLGVFEPNGLAVADVENLRMHYVETLEHWAARFEARTDDVRAMFDDAFVRRWRLYLNAAAAAFATGWLQLYQVVFSHQGELPKQIRPRQPISPTSALGRARPARPVSPGAPDAPG